MGFSKEKIRKMEQEKLKRTSRVDKLVMEELLRMGFSYSNTGTHYLHDCIVFSINDELREYESVRMLLQKANVKVSNKYGITTRSRARSVAAAIERAFEVGNVAYMLDVFKGVYD